MLVKWLEQRILKGIDKFFTGVKTAFANHQTDKIHILLSGNSCRSQIVMDYFTPLFVGKKKAKAPKADEENNVAEEIDERSTKRQQKMETLLNELYIGETMPKFIAYPPLKADDNNHTKPTAKTGVALGIIRLLPGNGIKVINHTVAQSGGQAPFRYFVGAFRRGVFNAALSHNGNYNEWQRLGVVSDNGIFSLIYTDSNTAAGTAKQGAPVLKTKRLQFVLTQASPVLARAIAPNKIEVCLAADVESADTYGEQSQEIELA